MLDEKVIAMAQGANYAAVTTLLPDGTPMTQPHWIDTDGEHLLVNTETHRAKYRNLMRDPRVTVMILEGANPYSYAEVRGEVVGTVTGPEARAHIDQLAKKYMDLDDYPGTIESERVIVKIAPHRTVTR